jgi:MerR family transcriptional regulator, heat shock protein HspR
MLYHADEHYLFDVDKLLTACLQIQRYLRDVNHMKRQDKYAARRGSENNASMPKYTIGVVSQLLGLPPQMLRRYEEAGLLEPARQSGKNRLYSDQDIAILEEISELSAQGVNAAGIRYIIQIRRHVVVLQQEVQQAREAQKQAEEEWRRLQDELSP